MKKLLWILLVIASSAGAQPADEARINVTGKLIAPPCTPGFPVTQQVDLGKASLSQLADDSAAATDVPLVFECKTGSVVTMKILAVLGSADSLTLLTSQPSLGLRLSLLHKSVKEDFTLGGASSWPVDAAPLELTLRVKPVSLDKIPEAGSYTATLLMQMIYR